MSSTTLTLWQRSWKVEQRWWRIPGQDGFSLMWHHTQDGRSTCHPTARTSHYFGIKIWLRSALSCVLYVLTIMNSHLHVWTDSIQCNLQLIQCKLQYIIVKYYNVLFRQTGGCIWWTISCYIGHCLLGNLGICRWYSHTVIPPLLHIDDYHLHVQPPQLPHIYSMTIRHQAGLWIRLLYSVQ